MEIEKGNSFTVMASSVPTARWVECSVGTHPKFTQQRICALFKIREIQTALIIFQFLKNMMTSIFFNQH